MQRAFGVKRQTVYDWVDEGKLIAYYIHGKQMFYRPHKQSEVQACQGKSRRSAALNQ